MIVLNILFIPVYGFVSCAWITLIVYGLMCVVSYILGAKYYPVPYQITQYCIVIGASILLWLLFLGLESHISVKSIHIVIKVIILSLMLLIIWMLQPKRKIA